MNRPLPLHIAKKYQSIWHNRLLCAQKLCQVLLGIQPILSGCDGQRIQHCAGGCSFCRIGKEPVLASHHKWSDGILGTVVADLNARIGEEGVQIFLFIESILHRLCQR